MGGATGSGHTGSYQRWLSAAGLFVLPFMVVVLVMVAQFHGPEVQATLEQGVVARHLNSGRGFTTGIVTPRSLVYNDHVIDHPELRQGPLSVLPTALLLKVLDEKEGRTLAFSSMLAWLIAVWLAYGIAGVVFGRGAGWVAALLMIFSPASLQYAVTGDGRLWAMPLLLGLWLVLTTPRTTTSRAVLAGVLLGLTGLVSYPLLLPLLLGVLPALAFDRGGDAAPGEEHAAAAAARPRPNLRGPLLALGVTVLVGLPWMARNLAATKNPLPGLGTYSVMSFTEDSPGRSIERRYLNPGQRPFQFVLSHKKQLRQKVLTGVYNIRSAASQTLDWPILALFLASLFVPLGGILGRARSALAWVLLWQSLLIALGSQELRLLALYNPLVTLYAAGFVVDRLPGLFPAPQRRWGVLWQPEALRRWAVAALVLVVAVPGLGPQMFSQRRETSPSDPNLKLISNLVGEQDVIVTDDPWMVAWETDRTCVWLPQGADDLQAIEQKQPLKLLYFTLRASPYSSTFAAAERGRWWSWAQAMPQGFTHFRPLDSRVQGERLLVNETMPAPAAPTAQ